jgi:hypothetical protein
MNEGQHARVIVHLIDGFESYSHGYSGTLCNVLVVHTLR